MFIKRFLKLFWLELKASSPASILLFPVLAVITSLLMLDTQAETLLRMEYVITVTEILFPLGMMLVAISLLLGDREKKSLSFVGVRSSLAVIWLRRLCFLFIWSTLWFGILLIVYDVFYVDLDTFKMLYSFFAISFVLISLSSFIAFLFREINSGYMVGAVLWGLCLINYGPAYDYLGPQLYPFYLWIDIKYRMGLEAWALNRYTLVVAGIYFSLAAIALLRSKDRFYS